MTVKDWFLGEKIDLDFLEEIAELSFYWNKSVDFIVEKWSTPVAALTEKQAAWATTILDDCTEKRINGKYYA